MRECVCFGSTALQHHCQSVTCGEYWCLLRKPHQPHLKILATHQACIDIDRTQGHHTALLKIEVQVLHDRHDMFSSDVVAVQLYCIEITAGKLHLTCNCVKVRTLIALSDFGTWPREWVAAVYCWFC